MPLIDVQSSIRVPINASIIYGELGAIMSQSFILGLSLERTFAGIVEE